MSRRPTNEFPPEGRIALPVVLDFDGTHKTFTFDASSIRNQRRPMIVRSMFYDTSNVILLNSNVKVSANGFGSLLIPSSSGGFPSQGIVPLPCTDPAVITIEALLKGGFFPSGKLVLVFLNFDADPYGVLALSTS